MARPEDKIPQLVKDLYAIVGRLEELFPGRKFTPDGHLVGSIGEVLAASEYGLELLPNSAEVHDAKTPDGRMVQIKVTQVHSVSISAEPEYLIVLKLDKDGKYREIYNGPGSVPWNKAGKMQKNGQRRIELSTLERLMSEVGTEKRVASVAT